MEIREENQDGATVIYISGEIDGTNVDDFEDAVSAASSKTTNLVLDLGELDYVSSTGLRVFLTTQKKMRQRGAKVVIRHVKKEVMSIFTVTGFVKLLNIEV